MTNKNLGKRIVVFDCGGRGGLHSSWWQFPGPLDYYSFEPEPDEYNQLSKSSKINSETGNRYTILSVGLGLHDERKSFHVCKIRASSSFYRNNPLTGYRFKNNSVEKIIEVDCRSITSVANELNIKPNYLTIDVEGSGLDLLEGAKSTLLNSVLGVRIEVEFAQIYDEAPLFDQSFNYLKTNGFFLARIETCNAGLYGITTDMNKFSVSPMDAMPLTSDLIMVNTRLIEKKLEELPTHSLANELFFLILYCIHNGCGYLGMDILSKLKESSLWEIFFSETNSINYTKFLEHLAIYISLPRKNINKGFNSAIEFKNLTNKELGLVLKYASEDCVKKIHTVYNDEALFKRHMEPDGHYAFIPFS